MELNVVRKGNQVKRYHTVNLLVPETVGHHSANVAGILIAIFHPVNPNGNLLCAALTHDWAEQFTGDVPATAKWISPSLAHAVKQMEEAWHEAIPLPRPGITLTNDEEALLKFADTYDLVVKCEEEIAMGNQEMAEVLFRGIESCESMLPNIDSQYRTKCEELLNGRK